MSIIECISACGPIRRVPPARTLFALLLAAAALCGCARHYDILLINSRQPITNVRIPDLDKNLGYYTYITAGGHRFTIPAGQVTYICPHGDTNWMFKDR